MSYICIKNVVPKLGTVYKKESAMNFENLSGRIYEHELNKFRNTNWITNQVIMVTIE